MHKHQCDRCGFIWKHEHSCGGDVKAHTCAICGEINFWKYDGQKRARVISCESVAFQTRSLREIVRRKR